MPQLLTEKNVMDAHSVHRFVPQTPLAQMKKVKCLPYSTQKNAGTAGPV